MSITFWSRNDFPQYREKTLFRYWFASVLFFFRSFLFFSRYLISFSTAKIEFKKLKSLNGMKQLGYFVYSCRQILSRFQLFCVHTAVILRIISFYCDLFTPMKRIFYTSLISEWTIWIQVFVFSFDLLLSTVDTIYSVIEIFKVCEEIFKLQKWIMCVRQCLMFATYICFFIYR